jgi:colicin import membrane protein
MKKLILLCFVFVFSNTFFAQTAKTATSKIKTEVKLKKDGTPDQRYNQVKTKTKAAVTTQKMKTQTTVKKQTATAKTAEKKVTDKATETYNGKKVYTGPKGGKYYINSNGNKTYITQ